MLAPTNVFLWLTFFLPCPVARDITEIGYELRLEDNSVITVLASEANPNPEPIFPLESWQYQCPSIVFFYITKKETHTYDCIKALSDLEYGINTQVIVQKTYKAQKTPDQ